MTSINKKPLVKAAIKIQALCTLIKLIIVVMKI
jgi:hypothetical protein